MLRDFRRASRTTRRLPALIAVTLVAAAISACGIKGPLKQPEAAPAAIPPAAVAPPAGNAEPSAPKSR